MSLETRKQVLGDEHVARASASATTLDAPFQQMITRLVWGELRGNDNLAQRIGLREAQLRQALMHVAIYAGVPVANHAFAMAKKLGWGEALE